MFEAIVGGIVVAVLWSIIVLAFWRVRRWWRLHGVGGDFKSTRKLNPEIVCERMSIEVDRNRLLVKSDDWSGGRYEATIVMSDELPGSGRGDYRHRQTVDGTPEWLWGFVELQVVSKDTLLVHHTYAHHKEFRAVVSGFVWERVP